MLICHCLYGLKGRERERERETKKNKSRSVVLGVGRCMWEFCGHLLCNTSKGIPIFHQTQTSTWSVLVATSWPQMGCSFSRWRYAMLMEEIQRTSSLGSFFHHFFPSVMFDKFGYNTYEKCSMLEEANPCISTGFNPNVCALRTRFQPVNEYKL